jgi:predicted DNA-binding protein
MTTYKTVSVRLITEVKERLDAEAKRLRMITGENVTVSELLRRYAESLPPAEESKEKNKGKNKAPK